MKEVVERAGLMNLVKYTPRYVDKHLIAAFVERWYPETNSFHLPFGEMTITLDDVFHICGVPVVGKPMTGVGPYIDEKNMLRLVKTCLGVKEDVVLKEIGKSNTFTIKMEWIRKLFVKMPKKPSEEYLGQRARAYVLFLLGSTLFCDKSGNTVPLYFLECLEDLEKIGGWSWGSGALVPEFGTCQSSRLQANRCVFANLRGKKDI